MTEKACPGFVTTISDLHQSCLTCGKSMREHKPVEVTSNWYDKYEVDPIEVFRDKINNSVSNIIFEGQFKGDVVANILRFMADLIQDGEIVSFKDLSWDGDTKMTVDIIPKLPRPTRFQVVEGDQ